MTRKIKNDVGIYLFMNSVLPCPPAWLAMKIQGTSQWSSLNPLEKATDA